MGGDLQTLYWTQGRYDLIATIDAPHDATMVAITLRTSSGGGVRTEVLRAFDADEMGRVLAKLD